ASQANGVEWVASGSLIVDTPYDAGTALQLLRVAYPSGQVSRITNDLDTYSGLSVTDDRRRFVTTRSEGQMEIWTTESGSPRGDVATTMHFPPNRVGSIVVAWANDYLLYSNGTGMISRVTPGMGATEEVLSHTALPFSVSADGRTIVYGQSSA